MEFELNENLNIPELAKAFQKKKRLQIKDILKPECAERLFKCLTEETPWGIVFYDGRTIVKKSFEEMSSMSPQEKQVLFTKINEQAAGKFQLFYNTYPIVDHYLAGTNKGFLLHKVLDFVNSETFINFMRGVTGISELYKADAGGTLFTNGNFLKIHTDEHVPENWRVAYVINLTKDWDPDWGGYLEFYDDDFNIEEALIPRFNYLNFFEVPKFHSVSYIPPYCRGKRTSLTGWVRTKSAN